MFASLCSSPLCGHSSFFFSRCRITLYTFRSLDVKLSLCVQRGFFFHFNRRLVVYFRFFHAFSKQQQTIHSTQHKFGGGWIVRNFFSSHFHINFSFGLASCVCSSLSQLHSFSIIWPVFSPRYSLFCVRYYTIHGQICFFPSLLSFMRLDV